MKVYVKLPSYNQATQRKTEHRFDGDEVHMN